MPLNWTFKTVEAKEKNCSTVEQVQITERLIYATMSSGLNVITEKNIDEWLFRLKMLYLILALNVGNITREDLINRIGLSTNASPITRTAFVKKMVDEVERMVK